MTDIRQCWAYNVAGQRCDMPAGHPGNHSIQQTWSDDECYAPILPTVSKPAPQPATAPIPAVKPEAAIKCVACSHAHRGGECKCGCYEFIG